jgi:hypothetical protein
MLAGWVAPAGADPRQVPSLAEVRRAAILGDVFPDGMRSEQFDRIEPLDFEPECMDGAHRGSRS